MRQQSTHLVQSIYLLFNTGESFINGTDDEGEKSVGCTSRHSTLSGKLFCDLLQQNKPLITGVPINIRLATIRSEVLLCHYDADITKIFKAFIQNPRIYDRRYMPAPDFIISMSKKLLIKMVKYHLECVVIRASDIFVAALSTVVSNI